MKLLIINGSPRGKGSNSTILINNFLSGVGKQFDDIGLVYLSAKKDDMQSVLIEMSKFSHVILIFPLYTDAMPGIVMKFIEVCGKNEQGFNDISFGVIIQSGFPESFHSKFIAAYMKKFITRIGARYNGCVIKGGIEGVKIMPLWMTRNLFRLFNDLGKGFGETGKFDEKIVSKLSEPVHLSKSRLFFFRLFGKLGLTNFYWDSQLKKNKVYKNRFAHPYIN